MKNTFGISVSVTLFGESHGPAIGAVLDGLAPGIAVDGDYIKSQLSLRRPSGNISTPRVEPDEYEILSGVKDGFTTGTPLCIIIKNTNTKSGDYDKMGFLARPGHADYPASVKYRGFEDRHGGGHFSGRITAALVAVGAICRKALEKKGIVIGTHIKSIGGISDRDFCDLSVDLAALQDKPFALLDDSNRDLMLRKIESAAAACDSVGGRLETAVTGLPAGVGEPWFDTVEGVLSHALFSIPAIKGVEFGRGFSLCDMMGSESNDAYFSQNGRVFTETDNCGGVFGGITSGTPLIFSCAVKPTPSISRPQKTVDCETLENGEITVSGRHDPCIVHRARAVVDAMTAITLCDLLSQHFGTDWLGEA